jgi:predicted transcriptional regulator
LEEFWEIFYDAIREMFNSDKILVFREIVKEPKTIKEIAEKLGMPYVTVRKYMRWGFERGLAVVVGTKKERGALSEKWLLTFVPEIVELKEDNLVVRIKLKLWMRKEFCEQVCPFKKECPTFEKIRANEVINPYREVVIEKRMAHGESYKVCKTPVVVVSN